MGQADRVTSSVGEQQRGITVEAEVARDPAEVRGIDGLGQRTAPGPERGGRERIEEDHVMPQPAQAQDVRKQDPRPASLTGNCRQGAGDHESERASRQMPIPMWSKISGRTVSESKKVSASRRAARACRS